MAATMWLITHARSNMVGGNDREFLGIYFQLLLRCRAITNLPIGNAGSVACIFSWACTRQLSGNPWIIMGL